MFGATLRALRTYPVDVKRLIAVSAIMSFTVDGVFPVIFNLYILRLGFGPDFVGMVNSVALVVFSLGSLPAGAVGARVGMRATLIGGVVVACASTVSLGLTDLLPAAWQAAWLVVMFSLLYLGVAFYFVNSAPAVVNLTAHDERPRVISVQSALGNLLAFVGGPLAGFLPVLMAAALGWSLTAPATYRVPLLVAGAMLGVALVLVVRVVDPTAGDASAARGEPGTATGAPAVAIAFGTTLVVLSLIRFLQAAGTGTALTFFNVYMDDGLGVSAPYIGMVVAVARLLSVFAALAVPWMVRRFGAAQAAVWGGAAVGLSLAPMALLPSALVGGLSYIVLTGATSVRYSAFFVYMMAVTPSRLRTTIAGAGEFSGGMSFALASFVGGLVIVRSGYTLLFLVSGAVTLAGSVLLWGYARWHARRERPLPLVEPGSAPTEIVGRPAEDGAILAPASAVSTE